MRFWYVLVFSIFLFAGRNTYAQSQSKKVKAPQQKLEKAIESKDEVEEAEAYLDLGKLYLENQNFNKSETYFTKAKNLYVNTQDKKGIAESSRLLAQVQEFLKKNTQAAINYDIASQNAVDSEEINLNRNDVSRLNSLDKEVQENLISQNIELNKGTGNEEEVALGYAQMADLNLKQEKIPEAIENYENAYEISRKEKPEIARSLNQSITDVYVKDQNIDKAIETKKKVLEEPFVEKNSKAKVEETQSLADLYIQKNETQEAEKLLKEAYQIAVDKGHTLDAKRTVEKLDSLFSKSRNATASLDLYRNFLQELPITLARDSTLLDNKLLAEIEARIGQLEKEKALQNEVLRRKNWFNYSLMASTGILALLAGLILFTLYKLRIKNKKIALQSLRREMNPHFIFNSLNSVNHFISSHDELEANRYLTRFSTLMRKVMENSKDDFIALNQELELIQNYLELEKSRFPEKFDYEIHVAENVNETIPFPVMLLQPFLENSIWHGLRYKDEKGWVKVNFVQENNELLISIEDNGIGIAQSEAQKTTHQKKRKGRGMHNTKERIKLLNELYGKKISYTITDKQKPEQGVLVTIKFKPENA